MRLLGQENLGGRILKHWLHNGENNQDVITSEITGDAEPAFKRAKALAQNQNPKSDFHFKASIDVTVLEEAIKISAQEWGISVKDAFAEVMQSRTSRSQKLLKLLTEGRDYRKFQASHYV